MLFEDRTIEFASDFEENRKNWLASREEVEERGPRWTRHVHQGISGAAVAEGAQARELAIYRDAANSLAHRTARHTQPLTKLFLRSVRPRGPELVRQYLCLRNRQFLFFFYEHKSVAANGRVIVFDRSIRSSDRSRCVGSG